jgi:hypothetical protein
VGHCYEFAVEIDPECEHAMVVAGDGSACECPTCGARCTGRFDACSAVLLRPGYVPVTAPEWARESARAPKSWHVDGPHAEGTNGDGRHEDASSDLDPVQWDTRELQTLTRELHDTVTRTVHEGVETMTRVANDAADRSDLHRFFDDIRNELDLVTRRQHDAIQSLRHEIDLISPRAQEAILGLGTEIDLAARRQQDAIQSLRHEIDLTMRRRQEVSDRLLDSVTTLTRQAEEERQVIRSMGKKLDRLARRLKKARKR